MDISSFFDIAFQRYKAETGKNIDYVITSTYRPNPAGSPHSVHGNAQDITLRKHGDYAPISEYNDLFEWMMDNWRYRAGIDNTLGNIHIHLDLAATKPKYQQLPFFFKEDNGRFQFQIVNKQDIYRTI